MYKNAYWLVNGEFFELHVKEFRSFVQVCDCKHSYNDEILLRFVKNENNPKEYFYASDFLNVLYDIITADSIENVKEQFEYMIIKHIQDKISYYVEILEKFEKNKDF